MKNKNSVNQTEIFGEEQKFCKSDWEQKFCKSDWNISWRTKILQIRLKYLAKRKNSVNQPEILGEGENKNSVNQTEILGGEQQFCKSD